MKKIITLVFVFIALAGSAFSKNTDIVNDRIVSSFNQAFHNATEVKWETKKEFVRATFRIGSQVMYAYYRENGEQIAVTRNLEITQLPMNLSISLKNKFDQFWLAELFEVASNGETRYYATLRNATHTVIFSSDGTGTWQMFKKEKI